MDENFFALLIQKLFSLPFRFLIPRGPYPVEIRREGRIGASWYAYDGDQERFRVELGRAEGILLDLLGRVEAEQRLTPRSRVLFGFSQGGYLGGYVAIRNPGLFDAMSILGARVKTEFLKQHLPAAAASGFRALLCHGARDGSVPPEAALQSREALADAGIDVDLKSFDAGHSVGRSQIEAISGWLRERFR
jgi:predicted esterase